MRYRRLAGSELEVSEIGFGASPLGNVFHPVESHEAKRAVCRAIEEGVNFFDVSPYYGRTLAEERLGAALEGLRHKVVLATKCGRYDTDFFDFSAARIEQSVEESLRRLRTDYVDVLHAHDIEFGDRHQIIEETIPALRKLQQQGKVRLIGISGFPLKMLADVAVQGRVDLVLSYCRYNLLIQDMDMHLTPVLREHGIALLNASPMHMGILTEEGPPSWHPAPEKVCQAGKRIVELCRRNGVDSAAFALRFCLNHPYVTTTFVGMPRPEYVDRNLSALTLAADPALVAQAQQVAGDALNVSWPSGRPENQDFG